MGWFETKGERHERLHNEGEKDASKSESTILGETNKHIPNPGPDFINNERDKEDNAAYKAGFENGVKNRDK